MTKRVLNLMGPYTGLVIDTDDTNAGIAVTDGWGRDLSTLSQPFDSSGERPGAAWPQSLKVWLSSVWPLNALFPYSITVNVVLITKTNPAVVTVAAGDIAKFNNGDLVKFAGTGAALLDNAPPMPISSKNAGAHTFNIAVNLLALPADITVGTVTNLL